MRKFTPYETNQLIKYGFDPFDLAKTIDPEIPIEYVTGWVEFSRHTFKVSSATLIPREETRDLLELALGYILDNNLKHVSFVDVGTGSGALGISLAKELELKGISYNGYLSDISDDALLVARRNLEDIVISRKANCFTYKREEDTLKIKKSDLLQDLPKKTKFNIIMANLPYIPTSRLKILDKSVINFEPRLALDGGEDGLKEIRKLLDQSDLYLAPKGIVMLEVDDTHDEKIAEQFGDWNIKVMNDFNDKTRFWVCSLLK